MPNDFIYPSGRSPEEMLREFNETLDYDICRSLEKCGRFIVACRYFLFHRPATDRVGGVNGHELSFNQNEIREMLRKAESWKETVGTTLGSGLSGGMFVQPLTFNR